MFLPPQPEEISNKRPNSPPLGIYSNKLNLLGFILFCSTSKEEQLYVMKLMKHSEVEVIRTISGSDNLKK